MWQRMGGASAADNSSLEASASFEGSDAGMADGDRADMQAQAFLMGWEPASRHNGHSDLQGGQPNPEQYFHLTEAQYILATQFADTTLSGLLSTTDWDTFNGKENVLTFSSGLTRLANAITSDLGTGKAGGQTIYGGTLTTQGLTIRANAADTTTGTVTVQCAAFATAALFSSTNATDATSTTSNSAMKTAGGLSVAKALFALSGTFTNAVTASTGAFSSALTAPTLPVGTATTGVATTALLDSMVPACMGDGVTTTFLHDGVRPIYRKDWQGAQLLYATARTNACLQSRAFGTSPWTNYWSPIFTANTDTGMDGTATIADTIEDADAVNSAAKMQDITVPNDSSTWCVQVGIKKVIGGSNSPSIVMNFRNGTSLASAVRVNPETGVVTVSGTLTPLAYGAQAVLIGGFWNVWLALANNGTGNTVLRVRLHPSDQNIPSSTGAAVFDWCQVENGVAPTARIFTTTAPVTVTDYATTGGIATLAEAPLAGSILYGVSDRSRVLGAAIADATSEADAVTKLNLLLAEMRTQGKIAT